MVDRDDWQSTTHEPRSSGSSPPDWRSGPPGNAAYNGNGSAEMTPPPDYAGPTSMPDSLRAALVDLQAACSDLTERLSGTYRELSSLEERMRRQEAAVRQREDVAMRMLSEAEPEAERASERARLIDQQISQRLASLAEAEQRLGEREAKTAETERQQTAEREWLNHYALTLNSVAVELERVLDEVEASRRSGVRG